MRFFKIIVACLTVLVVLIAASIVVALCVPMESSGAEGNYSKNYVVNHDVITLDIPKGDLEGYDNSLVPRMPFFQSVTFRYITPDDAAIQQLYQKLKPYTEGMTDSAKANFYLNFVESNVTYKTDSASHGFYEYYQYPLETLYLQTGDCEDMAFLLATLYKCAGLDTVLAISYNHAYTGVSIGPTSHAINKTIGSDTAYAIADPTGFPVAGTDNGESPYFVYDPSSTFESYIILVMCVIVILFFLWVLIKL